MIVLLSDLFRNKVSLDIVTLCHRDLDVGSIAEQSEIFSHGYICTYDSLSLSFFSDRSLEYVISECMYTQECQTQTRIRVHIYI